MLADCRHFDTEVCVDCLPFQPVAEYACKMLLSDRALAQNNILLYFIMMKQGISFLNEKGVATNLITCRVEPLDPPTEISDETFSNQLIFYGPAPKEKD